MSSPMGIGTDAYHPSWMIRTAITETSNVVRLEIWGSCFRLEWGILSTSFAIPCCSPKSVLLNRDAPLYVLSQPFLWGAIGGIVR